MIVWMVYHQFKKDAPAVKKNIEQGRHTKYLIALIIVHNEADAIIYPSGSRLVITKWAPIEHRVYFQFPISR